MKKYRLPDNAEWDKIVDEAFSSDEIHTFSGEYNMKKYHNFQVRKGITMKKNNLLMNLTVIATALAVIAVPTGVYVANNMTATKSDTQYANEEQEKNEQASPVAEKENDKIYDIEFGWLPEDFEYNNEESYTYFTNAGNEKIFMIASFMKNLSGEKTENGKALTVRYEYDTDDKTIDIRYNVDYVENSTDKNCMNYGRVATIYFKDTPYELELLVTDDITKDDFKKIIDNVKLVESDTEKAEIYTGEQVTETEFTISDGNDDGQVNEGIHQFTEDEIDYDTIYDVAYCWLPEGLEYQGQDSPYGGKFHNWTTDDGMTPMFTKVPKGSEYYEDTGNPEIETTKDEWLLDGKTVSMYHRSNYIPNNPELNFGRIAFIYFDNTPYVLKLYVTDGISEEDFRKIIDNVKLVPSEGETAGTYNYKEDEKMLQEYRSGHTENTDNTDNAEQIDFEVGSYEKMGTPADSLPIVQVGEPVQEIYPDVWGEVSATVTGVRFDDDFNGLTTDGRGWEADYSEYLDEDGKLIENVRRWVKFENGTETEFETETVPVSVMTVSITYTNDGAEPVKDYCVCPTLQTNYNGYFFNQCIYDIIKMETEISANNIDCIDTFRPFNADNLHFAFSCPNQSSKNNINLEPGESAEVMLAFIVEDKLRDNLYLSMNANGFVDLSNIE
ncbi:MAG: hypothetical protein NC205_06105 [Prevotella sp.]|nr:hypothetical protein [Alistipes senegalensis]MCM1358150.1 hypothetical protein [Prevotella sp.]MCM1473627.1 hypothetical protein [Muribaculaceae bacterium]